MRDNPGTIAASFTIPVDHPALPGHFPGNPLVPGVLLLAQVLHVLEAAGEMPARLRNLKHVKFIEPLLPGQNAVVTCSHSDTALSFSVTRGDRTIAKGSFGLDGVIGR
jgi:3-hydroxymyristoyl/3-hydroxydecanoyl-(acyl carrier protein) dehydratase